MKVELKEESEKGVFGRLILAEDNLQEWRSAQLQDPTISESIRAKETGERPNWQEVAPKGIFF